MSDTIHFDDHEFIFHGGFVRTHSLVAGVDGIAEDEKEFTIVYPERDQIVTIYKHNLLQHSVIRRVVDKVEETAVQKMVRELREAENKRIGVTGPKVARPTSTPTA